MNAGGNSLECFLFRKTAAAPPATAHNNVITSEAAAPIFITREK